MANPGIKINTEHPEFKKYKDDWTLYHDAFYGEGGFDGGGFLIPHPLEYDTDTKTTTAGYAKRQELAYYINYAGWLVEAKHSHLFKRPITRESKTASFTEWMKNVDGKGSSFGDFMKAAQKEAQIYGHVFLFMDLPKAPEALLKKSVVTKADQKAAGILPYLYLKTPSEVIDWAVDRQGNFIWVKVLETHYRYGSLPLGESSPLLEREEIQCVRIWTQDYTELWLKDPPKGEKESQRLETHAHLLGVVPVIPVYAQKGKTNEVSGSSSIKDIAPLCHRLYNLCSELDEWLRNQAFSILTFPVLPEDENPETIEVGTGRALSFNGNAKTGPQFIAAESSHAAAFEARIASCIEEIHRLGHMKFKGGVQQSGAAWGFDWEEVNNSLNDQARTMEEVERDVARLWFTYDTGKRMLQETALDFVVQYPESFSYSDEETEMVIFEKVTTAATKSIPSDTLFQELIRQRTTRLLPHLPPETREAIDTEIKEWKPSEEKKEKQEQENAMNQARMDAAAAQSEKNRVQAGKEKPPSQAGDKDNAGAKKK